MMILGFLARPSSLMNETNGICSATICKFGQNLELMKLKSVKQQGFISSREYKYISDILCMSVYASVRIII